MNDFDLCNYVLAVCATIPEGRSIKDIQEFWHLMEMRHPQKTSQVVAFYSRYDQDGNACPWYLLSSGETAPVLLHSIALKRLVESRENALRYLN